jgi:hypothetical protein
MAGTTHLLGAVWHRSDSAKAAALQNSKECVSFLRLVAESWPAAGHKADILEALVVDYAEPKPSKTQSLPKSIVQSSSPISTFPIATPAVPIPSSNAQPLSEPTPKPDSFAGGLEWFASTIGNSNVLFESEWSMST